MLPNMAIAHPDSNNPPYVIDYYAVSHRPTYKDVFIKYFLIANDVCN